MFYIHLECWLVHQQVSANYEPRPALAQDGEAERNTKQFESMIPTSRPHYKQVRNHSRLEAVRNTMDVVPGRERPLCVSRSVLDLGRF